MAERVIANDMPAFRDFCHDIRPLANVAPNKKKRRADIMLREDIEQLERMRIVWAIIKGERNLFRPARQAGEGTPEPLSGGSQGLVPQDSRSGSTGNGRSQHGRKL